VLLIGFVADEMLIAGSEDMMAALLGDGSVDANASGAPDPANPEAMNVSLVTMAMPKPVPAREVETAKPVEVAEPVGSIPPVESTPPAAADPVVAEMLDVSRSKAPEILAVTPLQPTQDENVVQQPTKEVIHPVEDEPAVTSVEKPLLQKPAMEKHVAEKRVAEKPQATVNKAAPAARARKGPAKQHRAATAAMSGAHAAASPMERTMAKTMPTEVPRVNRQRRAMLRYPIIPVR
jgi:protein TonB